MTQELYRTALEIRMLMAIATKKAMRAFEQRLDAAGHGISGLQYGIMRALSCHELTITELSHRFMLDPSTLVPAVDALERRGFVERGRDPNDRRRVPLSLTESGAAFVQSVPHTDDSDLLVQSLAEMKDPARQQLLGLLRDLVRHMPEGEEVLQRVGSRVQTHMDQFG